MNHFLLFLALVVGVVRGQDSMRPAQLADGPAKESEKPLREMEEEGIQEETNVAETRNAAFGFLLSPNGAFSRQKSPKIDIYCPREKRVLNTFVIDDFFEEVVCVPMPRYNMNYVVCQDTPCFGGERRCVPKHQVFRLEATCKQSQWGWQRRNLTISLVSDCLCVEI